MWTKIIWFTWHLQIVFSTSYITTWHIFDGWSLAPHSGHRKCYFTNSYHVQETCTQAEIYVRALQQHHSPTQLGDEGPIIASYSFNYILSTILNDKWHAAEAITVFVVNDNKMLFRGRKKTIFKKCYNRKIWFIRLIVGGSQPCSQPFRGPLVVYSA